MGKNISKTASHLPAECPRNEQGREVLLDVKNVDITFGKGDNAVRAVKNASFQIYKGETFSGVDYYTGVRAAKRLKEELGTDDLAATALRWFLMHPEVSVIIPGASLPEQIVNNVKVSELPALGDKEMQAVRRIYDEEVRPLVHQLW